MKKSTKHLLLSVIFLSLICITTYGYTFAKYVSNYAWDYYLGSKGFYFSSEELDTTKVTNVNNNWNFDSTYFTIKNSLNDFLITEYDIGYTVKCTIQNDDANYSKCTLNGTDSDSFTGVISSSYICKDNINDLDVSYYNQKDCESNGYEWTNQENYKDLYFDVVKTGEQEINDVSVLIEVTTTSPYKKTISGEFNLSSVEVEKSGLEISYKELSNYSRAIISNSYDEDKCVKLTWNSDNLRIDDSSENIISYQIDENRYINEIIFNIHKKDSISYIFYKTDFSRSYDNQEFNLIETNEC